jgi:hypothetical protein
LTGAASKGTPIRPLSFISSAHRFLSAKVNVAVFCTLGDIEIYWPLASSAPKHRQALCVISASISAIDRKILNLAGSPETDLSLLLRRAQPFTSARKILNSSLSSSFANKQRATVAFEQASTSPARSA